MRPLNIGIPYDRERFHLDLAVSVLLKGDDGALISPGFASRL